MCDICNHTYTHTIRLFIEKLPKHPEYAKAPPTDKTRIKKLVKQVLPRAMELKEKLKEKYGKEKGELEKALQQEVPMWVLHNVCKGEVLL